MMVCGSGSVVSGRRPVHAVLTHDHHRVKRARDCVRVCCGGARSPRLCKYRRKPQVPRSAAGAPPPATFPRQPARPPRHPPSAPPPRQKETGTAGAGRPGRPGFSGCPGCPGCPGRRYALPAPARRARTCATTTTEKIAPDTPTHQAVDLRAARRIVVVVVVVVVVILSQPRPPPPPTALVEPRCVQTAAAVGGRRRRRACDGGPTTDGTPPSVPDPGRELSVRQC